MRRSLLLSFVFFVFFPFYPSLGESNIKIDEAVKGGSSMFLISFFLWDSFPPPSLRFFFWLEGRETPFLSFSLPTFLWILRQIGFLSFVFPFQSVRTQSFFTYMWWENLPRFQQSLNSQVDCRSDLFSCGKNIFKKI